MVDAEKRDRVIRGLEICTNPGSCSERCPYYHIEITEGSCDYFLLTDALALLKERDETIASLQSTINKLNEAIQNTANQKTPKETEIPPETLEGFKRNEELLRQKINELYEELIFAKRAEIERLEAEIAKMPPLDYDKLAKNPPSYPVVLGFTCGSVTPKEEEDGNMDI